MAVEFPLHIRLGCRPTLLRAAWSTRSLLFGEKLSGGGPRVGPFSVYTKVSQAINVARAVSRRSTGAQWAGLALYVALKLWAIMNIYFSAIGGGLIARSRHDAWQDILMA